MRYDLVIFDLHGTLVDSASRLVPDAAEVLRDLTEAGLTLGVMSSKPEVAVRESLGRAQHLFDAYASQISVSERSQRLSLIVRRMEATLEHTLYVGDETGDVEAARIAGVASAAVTWGVTDRVTLAAAAPNMLAESLDELVRHIANRPILRLVT